MNTIDHIIGMPRDLVVPSCVLGPQRELLSANREFFSFWGYSEYDLADRPPSSEWFRLHPPDNPDDVIELLYTRKAPVKLQEVLGETPSGRHVWAGFSGIPYLGADGQVEAALLVFRSTQHRISDGTDDAPFGEDAERRLHHLEEAHRLLEDARSQLGPPGQTDEGAARKENEILMVVHHHLEKAYADMNEELEMARNIQEGLMPDRLPEAINLKSAALFMPAGKVGGDLYDMIITPHQKVAILIFDVSGHGVPAALIAAMAKMLFMHYIDRTESPAEVFTEVNRRMCKFVRSDRYLTAFLGILNPIENTMVYAKAGHVPPVIYHSMTGEVSSLQSRGFFIGHAALAEIAEYSEETVKLEPGDKVLFYTDGLTEGSNRTGQLFGSSRLRETIRANGPSDLDAFLHAILEEQTRFRGGCPLRDDFTMLAVETGSPGVFLRESGFTREDKPSILAISAIRSIEDVASMILREMDHCGFPDKHIKRTKVCIYEMLTNAIEHGNGGDPAKKTVVLYKVTPEKAMVSVVDEGAGFDYRNLPDPLAPENILKDHGRGVFIIRKYMDEVHFNAPGNRVMAVKYHRERK
jgi:serine phosphatase RsbU (regulator of sigma subunit)/anti-sigma regulatory factor (Ser/Thr protein kinase)